MHMRDMLNSESDNQSENLCSSLDTSNTRDTHGRLLHILARDNNNRIEGSEKAKLKVSVSLRRTHFATSRVVSLTGQRRETLMLVAATSLSSPTANFSLTTKEE